MTRQVPILNIAVGWILLVGQRPASPLPGVYVLPPEFIEPGTDDPSGCWLFLSLPLGAKVLHL